MTVKDKKLKLNYTIENKGKEVKRSYNFEVANDIANQTAKEVGEALATLIKDEIVEYDIAILENI